jgi:hypothetical protein
MKRSRPILQLVFYSILFSRAIPWTIYHAFIKATSWSFVIITSPLYVLLQFLAIQTYWPLIKQKKLDGTHNRVSSANN